MLKCILSGPNMLKWEGILMSFFVSHEHLEKCSYEVLARHYRYTIKISSTKIDGLYMSLIKNPSEN